MPLLITPMLRQRIDYAEAAPAPATLMLPFRRHYAELAITPYASHTPQLIAPLRFRYFICHFAADALFDAITPYFDFLFYFAIFRRYDIRDFQPLLIFSPIRQRHYAIASIAIDAAMLRAVCQAMALHAAAAAVTPPPPRCWPFITPPFSMPHFAMLILLFHIFSMQILPLIADADALLSFAVSAFSILFSPFSFRRQRHYFITPNIFI
jgi:hypothetical protein